MFKKYSGKLYCFSPPVMLATLILELSLALYTVWRYKLTTISRLVVCILISLAIFQGAEYMLCGGLGLTGVEWARLGYMAITLLPPLGLHLCIVLAKKKAALLVAAAYVTAAAFIYYFVFVTHSMAGQVCRANYAVFDLHETASWVYGLYYYGWLLVSAALAYGWSDGHAHKKELRALVLGYAVFIIPTTFFNIIDPTTIGGIPSIMCGFAVLLAIILVARILPLTTPRRPGSNGQSSVV
ncbi:MAG: hypothetical protein ABIQ04_02925 [Candidatus Saccharimonadales bacterium]